MFHVLVEYESLPKRSLENRLRNAVGKKESGSGFGFGVRDIEWTFQKEPDAQAAVSRLKRFKEVDSVTLFED